MTLTVRVESSPCLTEALYNLILSYYAGRGCSLRRPQQLSLHALLAALKVHFHMSTADSLQAVPSYTSVNGPSPSIKTVNASRQFSLRVGDLSERATSAICAENLTSLQNMLVIVQNIPLTCASHLADDATTQVQTLGKKYDIRASKDIPRRIPWNLSLFTY